MKDSSGRWLQVQRIGKFAFTLATATPGLGALSAEWAYKKAGWMKAYILKDMVVEYTKSVCDYFKERYGPTRAVYAFLGDDAERVAGLDAVLAEVGDAFIGGEGPSQWEYLVLTARRV